ncbi:C-GCAxxG-C-C family (seleno)protein [Alkaliphilus transvaalensis]|uniref:C-GCAxxG-C-C family (seleno)protein n=1 Tax=Alkaliphilus transvaalensis TaxID=114628 RepID=UPI00047CECD6|nr:C-GCAxxG-C-C family (seleno)protein [Alkaliphilus transvaalensis]
MLKEQVIKYYPDNHYNCAEAIIYAANDIYNLKLAKDTLKAMAGFGGGMAVEGVCGAISGGVAVIGILFTKEYAHEGDAVKELTKELINAVEEELGSSNCKVLKEKYRNEESKCKFIVEIIADKLESIINRELTKGANE